MLMNLPPECKIEGTTFGHCPRGFASDFPIPDGVTIIDTCAFFGCAKMSGVHIPDSVTRIGKFAFSGCTSLKDIQIPEGVTEIDDGAFEACRQITAVHIPNSVRRIGDEAFWECRKMAYAIVPETCSVGVDAFPPSCQIFNDISGYRTYLAQNLAEERAGDGVDVVGMHVPTEPISVDSRGGRDI